MGVHSQGNNFFKRQQFEAAIGKYKEACEIDNTVPAYYSNMAACYEKLGKYSEMADAAQNCIRADKKFLKGYFRLATAQRALSDYNGESIIRIMRGMELSEVNINIRINIREKPLRHSLHQNS